jgi:hypothetical protein
MNWKRNWSQQHNQIPVDDVQSLDKDSGIHFIDEAIASFYEPQTALTCCNLTL